MIGKDDNGPINEDGSSTASACINEHPEDIVKRRCKNRINARRSRDRKRLMMDTLQQEHWKLRIENKRIMMDNYKLREAIASIKAMRGTGNVVPSACDKSAQSNQTVSAGDPNQGRLNAVSKNEGGTRNAGSDNRPPDALGNPLMTLLLQQLLPLQHDIGCAPGGNRHLLHLLMAQAVLQQNQIAQGGFNPLVNAMGNLGVGFNPLLNGIGTIGDTVPPQQQEHPENQSQNALSNTGNITEALHPQQQQSSQSPATTFDYSVLQTREGPPHSFDAILQRFSGSIASTSNQGVASLLQALGGQGIAPHTHQDDNSRNIKIF